MAQRPDDEQDPLLTQTGQYTRAPKVSHEVLTKQEREELLKERAVKQQAAQRLNQPCAGGPMGRWWRKLQSGPDKVTLAMSIVALGVVYGDIGTSPLYTMQTFLAGQGGVTHADETAVIGMLSLVFWTMTLITTIEYVVICMRVDNKGEGGIFALYTLLRRYGGWLIVPAMIGGVEFLLSGDNHAGLALMGTVFLSITGAEALYSDMGHVGRGNIYATWPFINLALVLSYFGQGAWIIRTLEDPAYVQEGGSPNPFFAMLFPELRYVAVVLSVIAGVIASQALISGAFTIVSEATRLNWMPHLQVRYPARTRGQLYIPTINVVVCVATVAVLLIFRNSEHIAAAYGLALTVTMVMTSILVTVYLWHKRMHVAAVVFAVVFPTIMLLFFVASMAKFMHGGWFTALLTLAILTVMVTWNEGTKLERAQRRHMQLDDCLPVLQRLHDDATIPYYSDNIVYLTSDQDMKRMETDVFFSIFANHPKRAHAWWVVSVETTDDPFTREYTVEDYGTDYLFRVRICLGFKVSQSIPAYLHQIMHDLLRTGDLPQQTTRYPKVDADPKIGPIKYVLIHKALMPESKVSAKGAWALRIKYAIRHVAGSPVKWFGLAPYNPVTEVQPLFLSTVRPPRLKRVG
ncbi:KUP/HAK/KT family potassium transporter [Bifidobacterium pseudolongum]|uniref:KUP/HAK/KT family potassium transporter n=1 Tax=Bifidobacterium pseudolongum TaxID=1694 RepID=UPI001021C8A1|nr:KUP/HAK/KT family potassium transporter [Bifidobacterium pseudolongum]RYP98859.1 potassium transporter Kup [Bifidobacterium pseudolongum subsp. globosum]